MFYQAQHIGTPEHVAVEKNKNFSFPPHLHQCFEVILVQSGRMTVTVDNRVYELHQNEAALIFPHQEHSLRSVESEHKLCIFSPELVKTFARKTNEQLPLSNTFTMDEALLSLFNNLSENSDEIFKKGVLYLICNAFDTTAVYKNRTADNHHLLHKIFLFIDEQFDGDCTLAALSRKTGYNYSYISRYFKTAVGIPFNAYVNHYRLNHACYLLRSSGDTVLECALASGFVSLRSFNRNFKEQFGTTPAAYRKENQADSAK